MCLLSRSALAGLFIFIFSISAAGASFPKEAPLGAATIHRYDEPEVDPSHIAITVWVPMLTETFKGTLVNFNSAMLPQDLPKRWIIGDGSLTRTFIGIDLTSNSRLTVQIEEIYRDARLKGAESDEDIVEYLRTETNKRIQWTAGSRFNDGRAEFSWDRSISVKADVSKAFETAGLQALFHFPIAAGEKFPVTGLEKYISAGEGYCLQKALLASLVLSRAGISHRLVNGAVSTGPAKSVGHTWVELADGRVLDAAWGVLEKPARGHGTHKDWIQVGGSWRFENQNYLILALPEK